MNEFFGDFELHRDRRELRRAGEIVPTEPQVFDLLCLLIDNRDRVVTRAEISASIWQNKVVSDSAISSRIKSLRQVLDDSGKTQRYIRTVHGSGFRFVADLATRDTSGAESSLQKAAGEHPVIAVLPFSNLSGDPEQEYFSDAISQDIITHLGKHRWLGVIARNTTFGYKGKAVDIRQLSSELGASYVVEGTVRRAGNRIRVTAELVDAASGRQLWSGKYDRELEDIFELQDVITTRIAAQLEPEIGYAERQRVTRSGHANLKAWDCYHLGVAHFFKFTAADNRKAQEYLAKSRQLDPLFGEAHAWWAYAVVLGMVYWDTEPSQKNLDEALAATNQALEIDDRNAVFYALKARVQLARKEYEAAISENEIAIGLNPTLAAAHCGLADSLAYAGRYEEAIPRFELSVELSPNDPQRWAFLTYGALALIFKGDFEGALRWTERASEIPNCQYWTWAHQAVALAYLDRRGAMERAVEHLLRACPNFSLSFAEQKLFYLSRGEQLDRYMRGLAMTGVPRG